MPSAGLVLKFAASTSDLKESWWAWKPEVPGVSISMQMWVLSVLKPMVLGFSPSPVKKWQWREALKAEVKLKEPFLCSSAPKPLWIQSTINELMNYSIYFKSLTPLHRQISRLSEPAMPDSQTIRSREYSISLCLYLKVMKGKFTSENCLARHRMWVLRPVSREIDPRWWRLPCWCGSIPSPCWHAQYIRLCKSASVCRHVLGQLKSCVYSGALNTKIQLLNALLLLSPSLRAPQPICCLLASLSVSLPQATATSASS